MIRKGFTRCVLVVIAILFVASAASAENLCDPSYQNCRTQLLNLIANEKVEIDVGFWFMTDSRYVTAITGRWQAGVRVRMLVDPRANPTYTGNSTSLTNFASAGIPMRKRTASGILHWKTMLFAGQNVVEFGSANFSPSGFVPSTPYTNYVDETVYYSDDAAVVDSFKTEFDNSWVDTTNFANYANVKSLTREYPTYSIDADPNFPPAQNFATRNESAINGEKSKIDAIQFRITDASQADAIINAHGRGVPVRMIVDNGEYRNAKYLWDAYNVDRLYTAGIKLRWRGHDGENHEKLTLLYGQAMSIFGSSNWTSASASSQQEHNYFTKKSWIFSWFEDQFNRMWNNSAGHTETVAFVPAPPDKPSNKSPSDGATISGTSVTLKWYGGPWGQKYDVYFGTSSTPPLFSSNLQLGPSKTSTSYQTFSISNLKSGTRYYWQIVSKTMANKTATGAIWYFTVS